LCEYAATCEHHVQDAKHRIVVSRLFLNSLICSADISTLVSLDIEHRIIRSVSIFVDVAGGGYVKSGAPVQETVFAGRTSAKNEDRGLNFLRRKPGNYVFLLPR
jgi:hypothetical protein